MIDYLQYTVQFCRAHNPYRVKLFRTNIIIKAFHELPYFRPVLFFGRDIERNNKQSALSNPGFKYCSEFSLEGRMKVIN